MADVDEQVHVVAHDPAWAGAGRDLVRDISTALRGLPVDVAHIGSTAVPGLDAKPVIDVQVGCPGGEARLAVSRIEALGFEHLGQAGRTTCCSATVCRRTPPLPRGTPRPNGKRPTGRRACSRTRR